MGKSTINGHFPLLFVCSPEGIWFSVLDQVSRKILQISDSHGIPYYPMAVAQPVASTMPMYRTVNTALTMVEAMIHSTRKAAEAIEPTLVSESMES